MSIILKIELLIAVIFFILLVIRVIHKDMLTLKYSIMWFFSSVIALVSLLLSNYTERISSFLGFEVASNMVFAIGFGVIFCIAFSLTIIVSKQTNKINLLIQEVSILKSKMEKMGG